MKKVYCIIRCFTHKKNRNQGIHTGWLVRGGVYMRGVIHGVRQMSRKRRTYLQGRGGGGGLIGREIQYAVQSHFNKYNFQIQWIILQL